MKQLNVEQFLRLKFDRIAEAAVNLYSQEIRGVKCKPSVRLLFFSFLCRQRVFCFRYIYIYEIKLRLIYVRICVCLCPIWPYEGCRFLKFKPFSKITLNPSSDRGFQRPEELTESLGVRGGGGGGELEGERDGNRRRLCHDVTRGLGWGKLYFGHFVLARPAAGPKVGDVEPSTLPDWCAGPSPRWARDWPWPWP